MYDVVFCQDCGRREAKVVRKRTGGKVHLKVQEKTNDRDAIPLHAASANKAATTGMRIPAAIFVAELESDDAVVVDDL